MARRSSFRLGLTGTFGCGKSAVAAILAEQGAALIDADVLSRAVTEPGRPALAEIATRFGADVIGGTGELDRRLLAERAFAGRETIQRLTAIIHPRVRAEELRMLEELKDEPLVVLDIPLLYEVGAEDLTDAVAVVTVSEAQRFRRLKERGYDERQVTQRLAFQWPQSRKAARADYLIDNSGDIHSTRKQVLELLNHLRGEAEHA